MGKWLNEVDQESDHVIKVKSENLVCENSKFLIYLNHIISEFGEEVVDYLVVSPKTKGVNLVTGVAVLPMVKGSIGLIKIYRPALNAESWEIPHGFVEENEIPFEAATRELVEETGLSVKPQNLISAGLVTPDSGILAARVHIFIAKDCDVVSEIKYELGIKDFYLFSQDEIKRMVLDSTIQDSFTLSALCKYQLLFRNTVV